MKRKNLAAMLIATVLATPAFARVERYGPQRYTQVGRHERRADEHRRGEEEREERGVVIDRRRGPGWGGIAAAGLLGAAAGFALGNAVAPPVVIAPPVVGTVVPALPGECVTVPTYNGGVLYNCGNIYYQPFYQGTSLMFEVVPAP